MTSIVKTPLMKQYEEMKKKHPDAVLLFRVGDFYECFSEDAKTVSDILGITLVRRANGKAAYVELSGFPHHALDMYLPKLVRAGKRVAICEQLEEPSIKKDPKVSELITPNKLQQNNNLSFIDELYAILSTFDNVINKLHIYEEIRLKTQEIRALSTKLCISPRKAFEECYEISQPSLFD